MLRDHAPDSTFSLVSILTLPSEPVGTQKSILIAVLLGLARLVECHKEQEHSGSIDNARLRFEALYLALRDVLNKQLERVGLQFREMTQEELEKHRAQLAEEAEEK